MTYLPELRESLMEAARRESDRAADVAPAAHPRRSGGPHVLGGVATALALATAIGVALIALTLPGRSGSGGSASKPAARDRVARVAAQRALSELTLPAGAVRLNTAPGTLRTPSFPLPTSHRVDVYRVWRVHEPVERVLRFVEAHPPAGSTVGLSTEAGSGHARKAGHGAIPCPRSCRHFTVSEASVEFEFLHTDAPFDRQLSVSLVATNTGSTLLRADGEAGWFGPRTASERIASDVTRVRVGVTEVVRSRTGHAHRKQSVTSASGPRVPALAALLNGLPLTLAPDLQCDGRPSFNVAFQFLRAGGGRPVATAVYLPSCHAVLIQMKPAPSYWETVAGPSARSELMSFAPKLP